MAGRTPFDYAVVRLVPRVEREEFLNIGVIVHAPTRGFLGCRLFVDASRVGAFARHVDVAAIERHLAGFQAVCDGDRTAGPIAGFSMTERFHWLVAPRSTVIQSSPVHGGVCDEPAEALRELFAGRVG